MYGQFQNPAQNKLISNQFVGKPLDQHLKLPIIRNKFRDVEDEKQRLVNETLNFVGNKSKRALASRGPFTNYPLYNPDIVNFLNNYPQSLMHYRPIRYFFQRPVQLDERYHFPHQKEAIIQNRAEYHAAKDLRERIKPKYAKPLKYRDLVNEAEELELPMAKVITAGEVNKKIEELNKVKEDLFKLDPKRKKEIRQKNKRQWALLYKLNNILKFWKILDDWKKGSKKYKIEKTLLDRAQKADMITLFKYMGDILKGLEDYIIENFGDYFSFNSNNQRKNEDNIFKVKHFIHKIFHDLSISVSDKSDLDSNIRGTLLNYITEGSFVNPNFLTTMDFNRLEFGLDWKLINLTHERKAMILGNLMLYKVLMYEILRNPNLYFRNLEKTKIGGTRVKHQYEFMEPRKPQERRNDTIEKSKEELELEDIGKKDINKILENNFQIVNHILNYILRDAFKLSPPIQREKLKESFMFKYFVHEANNISSDNMINVKLAGDDHEIARKLPVHEQAKVFIRDNQRWCNMYRMNAYAFCVSLVDLCLASEMQNQHAQSEISRERRVQELREKRRNDELYGEDEEEELEDRDS